MPQIENAIGAIRAIQEVDMVMRFQELMGTSAGALVASVFSSYDQNITQLENTVKSSPASRWFKLNVWQAVKSVFGKRDRVLVHLRFNAGNLRVNSVYVNCERSESLQDRLLVNIIIALVYL